MIKTLIAATASVALMSGTALSQTAPAPAETPAPLTVTNKELFKPMAAAPAVSDVSSLTKASEGQILASGFLGKAVYNGDGDNAETIGDLNDLVIGQDGMVQAAIIGVGGFLGVGEKDVAMSPSQLKLSVRSDGKSWLVVDTTKEQLKAAPGFDRSANFTDGMADPMKTSATKSDASAPAPMETPAKQ
ncbi:MAG: PRC-barrel domain-containing protein [Phyllobacterium sp.]|uniref:PRC-barrel domain-containing protein n=1 Tax=Phyllobacterium sp. TaxID=1871046 RepID=UPI0030F1D7A3